MQDRHLCASSTSCEFVLDLLSPNTPLPRRFRVSTGAFAQRLRLALVSEGQPLSELLFAQPAQVAFPVVEELPAGHALVHHSQAA